MLLSRTRPPAVVRAMRPASPRCRGGVSSLLRLAQPAAPRLPVPGDLSGWLDRAASAVLPVTLPVTGPHGVWAVSELGVVGASAA